VIGRNGNGPVLDGNSALRFTKNLILPLTYSWSKSHLITLTFSIVILIGVVLKWRLIYCHIRALVKAKLGRRFADYLPSNEDSLSPQLFFMLSFIAYIPTALWYVSPRHLYLPIILFVLGIGSIPMDKLNKFLIGKPHLFVSILSLILFVVSTFQVQRSQEFKSQVREAVYLQVDAQLSEKEKSKCIYLHSKNESTKEYLRYEMTNPALAFFTGNQSYYLANCQTASNLELLHIDACDASVSGQVKSQSWIIFIETKTVNGNPSFSRSFTCK
jgi:hypothetical protein